MDLFATLDSYYDAAPRPAARTEEVGRFTLFVRSSDAGWPYYARPRLGVDAHFTSAEVELVRRRQRELGVPESLEWVHESSPTLLAAAREAGLSVAECPLLVLPDGVATVAPPLPNGVRVTMLDAADPDLAASQSAVSAGFAGRNDLDPCPVDHVAEQMRAGLMATASAYDAQGAVGGGAHAPRGTSAELAGIAVIPRARRQGIGAAITAVLVQDARARGMTTVFLSAQDEAVARVYERIGFQRVGTACIAEPPDAPARGASTPGP